MEKRYISIMLFLMMAFSFVAVGAKTLNIDNNNKQRDIIVRTADTTSDDAVTIGGKLVVNGVVNGDAVSVGGLVHINGKITGDLVLIGSSGEIGPNTVVNGSFVNIGSSVKITKGAVFSGGKTSINLGPINRLIGNGYLHKYGYLHHRKLFSLEVERASWLRFFSNFIIFYLISLAIVVLFKTGTKNMEKTLSINPFATFLAGFLVELVLIPTIIVLMISLIGIPFIPILILTFFVFLIFGSAVLTYMIGKYSVNKMGERRMHIALTVLAGMILINIIPFVNSFISIYSRTIWIKVLFLSLTFTEWYILVTYAIGAVILSLFGTRVYKGGGNTNDG